MSRILTVRVVVCAALLSLVACSSDVTPRDGAPQERDASATPADATLPDPGDGGLDASSPDAGSDAGVCLSIGTSCTESGAACCGDLSCGHTTAGQVCCGNEGATCATADGADCCGDLLCVGGHCQPSGGPAPTFAAPYSCGERWTYSHHSAEVRLALDFVRADGGETNGAPALASAPGVAYRRNEPGGAGQYVAIEHGDGWKTYYFHLSAYTVADGAWIDTGEEVGRVGSTGASSGPHLHYEQLHHGAGQTIHIDGVSLAPYPGTYGSRHLVSENGCSADGRAFDTWGTDRPVHESPSLSSPVVTTLAGPTRVHAECQTRGDPVTAEGYTNDWWSRLRDEGGYISNIYVDDPASMLPGVPECP